VATSEHASATVRAANFTGVPRDAAP